MLCFWAEQVTSSHVIISEKYNWDARSLPKLETPTDVKVHHNLVATCSTKINYVNAKAAANLDRRLSMEQSKTGSTPCARSISADVGQAPASSSFFVLFELQWIKKWLLNNEHSYLTLTQITANNVFYQQCNWQLANPQFC